MRPDEMTPDAINGINAEIRRELARAEGNLRAVQIHRDNGEVTAINGKPLDEVEKFWTERRDYWQGQILENPWTIADGGEPGQKLYFVGDTFEEAVKGPAYTSRRDAGIVAEGQKRWEAIVVIEGWREV